MADNNNNVYRNKNDEIVPRVSDIIKMLNKEVLLFWANSLGYKHISYKSELDRTSKIGSAIHDMIETYNNPRKLALYNWRKYQIYNRYDRNEVINGMRSYAKWYDKNHKRYDIVYSEKTIVGKYFGGTMDGIIRSPYNKNNFIIVDYKTSSSIHMTHFLQLAAYVYLCETELGLTIDGIMVLRMDKKYGKMAEDALILRNDLDIFIKLFLHLYNTLILNNKIDKLLKTIIKQF